MNLLLTSVGSAVCLLRYFKKALDGIGCLHAAVSSSKSPVFQFADVSIVSPKPHEENYIAFLLNYCTENQIEALIPFSDADLRPLSLNKSLFERAGIKVLVSDIDTVSICCDKWQTYGFCLKNDIRTPKTYLSVEDALYDIEKNIISFPLIVKPRWGHGSLYIFEADDEDELLTFFKKTRKNIMSSDLRYETDGPNDNNVLIQQKLDVQEYGMDVINDLNANYRNSIVKIKYSMRSGSTECGEVIDSDILKKLGSFLSGRIRHIGNLDVDLFMEGDTPYLLEMNPRFGGGYYFSHLAGADLPLAIVKWIKKESVAQEIFKEKYGVISHKYKDAVKVFPLTE
ncbi:MAG: ATP-grasp domain-containing protein [Synergistaceae bacterium]|nr:ATP-grasp domain-containing protein [Synergistaceae bacterium]